MSAPQTSTEYTVQAAENAAYPLDVTEFDIDIEVKPGVVCTHKLRKPTLDQLVKREEQSVYETEEIDKGQDRIMVDDERANVALWDAIAISVKGYRTGGRQADEWIGMTPEIAARIPGSHKATAIRGLYTSACEVISSGDDSDGYNLDGETFTIKQELGGGETPAYILFHVLRQPTEGERQDYKRKSSSTVLVRGSKKTRARVVTNLRAAVELYDKLFESIDGVTGVPENNIVRTLDPVWKRQVVSTLMTTFEAGLSD